MAWLSGFSNRLKLTIQHDNVDSNLTDFPIMVTLSSGSGKNNFDTTAIFDTLGDTNRKKIAVTKSDGVTQCPVEIEYWDATEKKAVLWTKSPIVYSSVDTDLYLYYDATYSGATPSGNTLYVGEITDTVYEMVVDKGDEGTYDTLEVYSPSVIKDGSIYKMWYGGSDSSAIRILYCTSTDGVSWSGNKLVIDKGSEGTYDTSYVMDPIVIKDGSVYKMWYAGYNGSYWRIIYCTSTDGINWSNFQMVINIGSEGTYDTNRVSAPTVIKDDFVYKMWYRGYDGSYNRIIYCTSTDGINWSNFQMVINIGSEGTYDTNKASAPTVIKDGSIYKMWYTGNDGSHNRIIYCTSTDGINWSNFQMVVNIGSEGTYDTSHAHAPTVIKDDSVYKMWYEGRDASYSRIIYTINWVNPVYDVWDDNFVGVWHMAQDPSGGAKSIKDSTRNLKHGTPHGSMVSGNLVAGKIGKAVYFDGNDDYIDLLNQSKIIPSNNDFTIEGVSSITNTGTFFGAGGNSGDTWSVQLHKSVYYFVVNNELVTIDITDASSAFHYFATVRNGNDFNAYVDGLFDTYVSKSGVLRGATNGFVDKAIIGGLWRSGQAMYLMQGTVDEIRVSNVIRTSAWIKATYYSNWDNLITFDFEPRYLGYFSGHVFEQDNPVQRKLYLHDRDSGFLIATTTSSGNGYYYLETTYSGAHYIICLDDMGGESYNDLVIGNVYPTTLSG